MSADLWQAAVRHRRELDAVPFIAITGSCGKTTTKDLAAGILATALRGTTSPGSGNCGDDLAASVLAVSPDDAFCLQELGAWGPGTLDPGVELVRPRVGVVLNVRLDHHGAFHGLAATAEEKAKVVAVLPPTGLGILNADDDFVLEMRTTISARVLTFGRASDADLRATEVSAAWPERLSFTLTMGGTSRPVTTRLVGAQGLGSALAAIAIGTALGVPVDAAVAALDSIEPPARRMSPVVLPDGVVIIRDDFKAPSDSLPDVLAFLGSARARRRILIIGRISDHPGRSRPIYERWAHAASGIVDELIFVGQRVFDLWGSDPPSSAGAQVFRTVREAAQHLGPDLREGDLVLLKGSGPVDHLERVLLDRTVGVRCWQEACGRVIACDECELLQRPFHGRGPS